MDSVHDHTIRSLGGIVIFPVLPRLHSLPAVGCVLWAAMAIVLFFNIPFTAPLGERQRLGASIPIVGGFYGRDKGCTARRPFFLNTVSILDESDSKAS